MRFAFCLFVLFWPLELFAQTKIVRTGWHLEFTRLVLPIPVGTEWNAISVDGGYLIQTPNVGDFDLGQAYERIPRERVNRISQAEEGLRIEVACDCHIDAFLWRPNRLIVDVVDGPPPDSSLFEAVTDSYQMPRLLDLNLSIERDAESAKTLEDISPLRQLQIDQDSNVDAFAHSVAANLQRGILQGILEPNPESVAESKNTLEKTEASIPAANSAPELADLGQSLGLEASTSVEIALDLAPLALETERPQQNCWPDSFVNVSTWAAGLGFSEDVALLRQNLFSDLEKPNAAGYRKLARAYVFYGFGAEAIEIVDASPDQSADLVAIGDLGRLIDGLSEGGSNLGSQLECPGKVALWALLMNRDSSVNPDVDITGIVQQFRDLPDPLRMHLTPRMAERLADIGQKDAAKFLLDGGKDRPELQEDLALVRAQIAEQEGEKEEAETVLSGIPELDPDILTRLVALRISEGRQIESTLIKDLEAALYYFRSSPDAATLFSALIDALVHQDDFAQALAAIDRFSTSVPENTLVVANSSALGALADRGKDVLFLEFAFSDRPEFSTPQTQNKYAQRLLALGFGDRALELMSESAAGDVMAERRLLRAEALIQKRLPELVRKELAGITTPQALALLRRASDLLDSKEKTPAEALDVISPDAESEDGSDRIFETAAELIARESRLDPTSSTPLRDSAELLSQSESTRQTVEGLLERFQVD